MYSDRIDLRLCDFSMPIFLYTVALNCLYHTTTYSTRKGFY